MKKTCFVKNTYELVSKKWLFQILCCFKDKKKHRFTEIMKSLKKISTKTLSQRLAELVKNEIPCEFLGPFKIKGKELPVNVYSVRGLDEQ